MERETNPTFQLPVSTLLWDFCLVCESEVMVACGDKYFLTTVSRTKLNVMVILIKN